MLRDDKPKTEEVKRITEVADRCGLKVHLVDYPPYHGMYNPVERMRGHPGHLS